MFIKKMALMLSFYIPSLYPLYITDYSKIYNGTVLNIATPHSVTQLQPLVKKHNKIAIAGGNYSMGGHTWCNNGVVIDMKYVNKILNLDNTNKTLTVQAGARWYEIQEFLHPFNLTVKVMQSYNNFSVGGSLSVNVHGRSFYGSIITTVLSLRIMLANGSIVHTSRTEKPELFSAVIGGYGGCGIIVDVTLQLEDNYKIKEVITATPIKEFLSFYNNSVAHNPDITFFNGFMYPPYFNTVVNFCWHKTDDALTIPDRSRAHASNPLKDCMFKNVEFCAIHLPSTQKIRQSKDIKSSKKNKVVWRSYEMSHAVEDLAPHWSYASKILQEYFIPVEHFDAFVHDMTTIIKKHNAKMLNISIRYVPQNTESLLTYAPKDCFAFVCYIVLFRNEKDIAATKQWTQELIDAALKYNGTYYLPYHRFARPDQMLKAYPHYSEFLDIKNYYDPLCKFQNNLLVAFENALQ